MLNRQERVKTKTNSASITILPKISQLDQLLVVSTKMAALRKEIGLVQGVKAYVNFHLIDLRKTLTFPLQST